VKRLAELHNGWAEAASPGPGRGATFTVGFPAIPPGERPRAAAPRAEAPPVERRRVLVVEDNADARESLALLLRMGGHEVLVAQDGAEGLRLASSARPDVALVDVGLPDLSGYEMARRLRASPESAQLRLVALTGYGGEQDRRLAL